MWTKVWQHRLIVIKCYLKTNFSSILHFQQLFIVDIADNIGNGLVDSLQISHERRKSFEALELSNWDRNECLP